MGGLRRGNFGVGAGWKCGDLLRGREGVFFAAECGWNCGSWNYSLLFPMFLFLNCLEGICVFDGSWKRLDKKKGHFVLGFCWRVGFQICGRQCFTLIVSSSFFFSSSFFKSCLSRFFLLLPSFLFAFFCFSFFFPSCSLCVLRPTPFWLESASLCCNIRK